jgi:hypothetical protein
VTGERRSELLTRLFTPTGKPRANLRDEPPLSSGDVAALFQMTDRAIRMWASKGNLPHERTLGGGRLHYPADKIAELYAARRRTAELVGTPASSGRRRAS